MRHRPLMTTLAASLAGCMAQSPPIGHDYAQSAFGVFTLNGTTLEQAEAALGPPFRQTTLRGIAKPGATLIAPGTPLALTTLNYYFAPFGTGLRGPHPFKSAIVIFLDDRLIAYQLSNAIPGEVTPPIDEARLGELRQGRTTRDEAIALFGMPIGQRVHMLDAQAGTSEIAYGWIHRSGSTVESRMLQISFDRAGRMTTYAILDNAYPLNGGPVPNFAPPPTLPGGPNTPMPHVTHPAPDLEHT